MKSNPFPSIPWARPALAAFATLLVLATAAPAQPEAPTPPIPAPSAAPAPGESATPVPAPADRPAPRSRDRQTAVVFNGDATLAAGERAEVVVSILGNSTSAGRVDDNVISIVGSSRVTGGPVGDSVVSILGSTHVDADVRDAVAILGDVVLGPNAVVRGDIVAIGGQVRRDPGAIVHGETVNVAFGGVFDNFDWLKTWLVRCVLLGRPLAFGADLGWAWKVAGAYLLLYIVVALLFRGTVEKCAATIETRPGGALVAGLIGVVASPLVMTLVGVTGVGVVIFPIFGLAMKLVSIFGRATLLAWLGRRMGGAIGTTPPAALAVLAGGILVALLYTIPFVGYVVWQLIGFFGFGAVLYTLFAATQRERAPGPVAAAPGVGAVGFYGVPSPADGIPPLPGMGEAEGAPRAAFAEPPPAFAAPELVWARGGFWLRLFALLIDAVLIGILVGPITDGVAILPALLVYSACLWKFKGTTIGGIVCGLKVVRRDGRPVDWTTAIVRSLGCVISAGVAGLGFIWTAFDREKQSWHDKIAGTVVVRPPRGISLV